jgi:hypothetical protein
MSGLESDTIGGYNAMMGKQREIGGGITVTIPALESEPSAQALQPHEPL